VAALTLFASAALLLGAAVCAFVAALVDSLPRGWC
jgi:uncharacterized membrane protein